MPDHLQGLLEPYARTTCTYGSEGAGAQQCAPATRLLSPLLANLALEVLDEHFTQEWDRHGAQWNRRRYRLRGGATFRLIRYADDFVVMVFGQRDHVEALRARIDTVLDPVGLRLAPDKTQVVHIDEGFDFLGFHIQRHRQWGGHQRYVYCYPSRKSVASIRRKIKALTSKQNTNQAVDVLFVRLGQLTRGWSLYFRYGNSKAAFADLQNYLWGRVWTWLQKKHPKQGRKWIVSRYYRPGWWPKTGEVNLYEPAKMRIRRYRYRGRRIPTPWAPTTRTSTA